MKIDRIDHIVLTVRDIEATCEFYARVLGMGVVTPAADARRSSLARKFNLHESGRSSAGPHPTPGSVTCA
jgi:catechol 2,3-dioxygenase-like lactoylglutathione lyase family enzyme